MHRLCQVRFVSGYVSKVDVPDESVSMVAVADESVSKVAVPNQCVKGSGRIYVKGRCSG